MVTHTFSGFPILPPPSPSLQLRIVPYHPAARGNRSGSLSSRRSRMMIRRGMWAGLVALVGAGLGLPVVALGDDAPERQSAFTARPELEPAFFDVVRKDAAESVRAERVRAEQRKHMMFGLVVYMEPMPTGLLPAFGECFIQTQKSNSGRRVLPQAAAADADTREQFDIKQIDINDPDC